MLTGVKICTVLYVHTRYNVIDGVESAALNTYRRVFNRVRLPILLVVSRKRKMNISFATENLVSRDGFVRPSRPESAWLFSKLKLNLVLTRGNPPDFRGGVRPFLPREGERGMDSCSSGNDPGAMGGNQPL